MDKNLLKRALKQTFASPDDKDTDEVLDTLATNLLKNLHKEKANTNILVSEAFQSGGISALENLYQRVLSSDKISFKKIDIKNLINEEAKLLK